MAICKLNKNLTRSNQCGYNLPEIVELYLVNYEDLTSTEFSSSAGCEVITAITIDSASTGVVKVEPAKNSASFEDTLVVEDSGNKYRHAQITFNVVGTYDGCMHGALDALSLGRYFVVASTADGNYLGFGRIAPLEAETATFAGGSDTNGINVVLSGNIAESPMVLDETAVAYIKSKVIAEQ